MKGDEGMEGWRDEGMRGRRRATGSTSISAQKLSERTGESGPSKSSLAKSIGVPAADLGDAGVRANRGVDWESIKERDG